MKKEKYSTTAKKGKRIVMIMATLAAVICLFALSNNFMMTKAADVSAAAYTHELSFTQQELLGLVRAAVSEERQADVSVLDTLDTLWAAEESPELPLAVQPKELQTAWVQQQLEGKRLLDTRVEEDGCVAFVAFDTEALQLQVVTVNPTSEVHAFVVNVEHYRSAMPALAETFTMQAEEVIAPEEGPVQEQTDSLPQQAAASSEVSPVEEPVEQEPQEPLEVEENDTSASVALAGEELVVPASAQRQPLKILPLGTGKTVVAQLKEEVAPLEVQPEAEESTNQPPATSAEEAADIVEQETGEPVSPKPAASPEEANTEDTLLAEEILSETYKTFTIENKTSEAYDRSEKGTAVVVQPGGMGVVSVTTGLLHGGPLSAAGNTPMRRSFMAKPLTGIELWTGTADKHGVLRIYHKDQGAAQTAGYDYATYSLDDHVAAYDIDSTTDIKIYPYGTTSSRRNFTVELRNTAPVTIKSLGMQPSPSGQNPGGTAAAASTSTTLTIIKASGVDKPVLNIVTDTGNAITYAGILNITGPVSIKAAAGADGWAVGRTEALDYSNTMTFANLELNASGGGGIDAGTDFTSTNSIITLNGITGIAEQNAMHVGGAGTLTTTTLLLENVAGVKNGLYIGSTLSSTGAITLKNVTAAENGAYINGGTTNIAGTDILLDKVVCGGDGFRVNSGTTTFNNGSLKAQNKTATGGDVFHFYGVSNTSANKFKNTTIDIDAGASMGHGLYIGSDFELENSTNTVNITANNIAAGKYLMWAGGNLTITGTGAPITLNAGESAGGGMYSGGELAISGATLDFKANNMAAGATAAASSYLVKGNDEVTINNGAKIMLDTGESAGGGLYSASEFVANGIEMNLNGNAVSAENGLLYSAGTTRFTDFNLSVTGGESAGRSVYTRTLTVVKSNVDIKANGSTTSVMEMNGSYAYLNASKFIIDAGNSTGKSLYGHYGATSTTGFTLRLGTGYSSTATNQASSSSISIVRGTSEDDAMLIRGTTNVYQKSFIDVKSDSEFGRNIYLYRLNLRNEASVSAEGNMWSVLPQDPDPVDPGEPEEPGGETEEPGGETEEPEEPDEPDPVEPTDPEITANTELESYRDKSNPKNQAAIIYIESRTRLYNKECSLTAKGNSDTQKNLDKITPIALVVDASYLQIVDGAAVKATDAEIGVRCYTLRIYGPTATTATDRSYATLETIDNAERSRLFGEGTHYGIILVDYLIPRRQFNIYAEGGVSGLMFRRTYMYTDTSRTDREGSTILARGTGVLSTGMVVTERGDFYSGMRIIAEGGTHGANLTRRGSRIQLIRHSELIAIGRGEGAELSGEEGYISAGLYANTDLSRGNIRAYDGGKIYARGTKYGIYSENTNIESTAGGSSSAYEPSTIIGIGGVDNKNLDGNKEELDYFTITFDFDGETLPKPIVSKGNNASQVWKESEIEVPGLVPYKKETGGIVTGGARRPYIYCRYKGSSMLGYGGEWGIVNSSEALESDDPENDDESVGGYIRSYYSGNIEGHGGMVGVKAGNYIRAYSSGSLGHSYIRGFGKEYGVYATGYMRSAGSASSQGFLYGIGTINGLYAGGYFLSDTDGAIVGETWIDPEAEAGAMTEPAVKTSARDGRMRVPGRRSYIHEIYNPINLVFVTPDPYQFNVEFDAVGQNMGAAEDVTLKYKWTTPKNHPDPSTGDDYLSYNATKWANYLATDNQRLLMAVNGPTLDGGYQPGLMAYGFNPDTTVVASRTGLGTASRRDGNIYGDGTHRVTFRHVKLRDLRTLEVEIDLREMLAGTNLDLTNIPLETLFELEFRPFDPEGLEEQGGMDTIELKDGVAGYDAATGKMTLYKLRLGEYVLKPKVQIGWPFKAIEDIPFTVDIDRRADANGPGGLVSDSSSGEDVREAWPVERWIESVFLGSYNEEGKWVKLDTSKGKVTNDVTTGTGGYTHTDAGHSEIAVPNRDVDPSITPPEGPDNQDDERLLFKNLYNVTSYYVGKFEVYYNREEYNLRPSIVDIETRDALGGGRMTITPALNGNSVPGLEAKEIRYNTTSGGNWLTNYKVYAGLDYTFEQTTTAIAYYTNVNTPYTIRIMQDNTLEEPANKHYPEVLLDNEAYTSWGVDEGDINYYVELALETTRRASYIVKVLDRDNYVVNGVEELLAGSKMKLQAKNAAGEWVDTTSTSMVDNGDGTFTLTAKSPTGSRFYRLIQEKAASGYAKREGFYEYEVGGLSTSGTAYRIYYNSTASNVPIDENGENGWTALASATGNGPIRITNVMNIGDLDVTVNAAGLWAPHGDAVFLVELKGTGGISAGRLYYNYVKLDGSMNLETYEQYVSTGTAQFRNVQAGTYTVTVYGGLRCEEEISKTAIQVGRASSTQVFNFACQNHRYFSGGDVTGTDYVIDFS